MIKVKVENEIKTVDEMSAMLGWVIKTFPNEMDPDRWTYGRDTPDPYGGELLNGPWEIEYFEFRDPKEAIMFKLRWA